MRNSDVVIRKCFLCALDPREQFPAYNEFLPGTEGEVSKYLIKLLTYNKANIKSKPAAYNADSYLMQILPEQEEGFEAFVNIISDEIFNLMREHTSLLPGCGVFVWALIEEQNHIGFFKLDYQSRLMNSVEKDGRVAWKLNQNLLPATSQKGSEFFIINTDTQRIMVSDKTYDLNHDDHPVNFIAEYILKVRLNNSEQEMLDKIEDSVLDTISECYREDIQQKVFAYRTAMAEKVEEDGRIRMDEVAEEIFADNADAINVCREKLQDSHVPRIPVIVGPNVEKKLLKKHKIVTSNGIEILVPPNLLKDAASFEYGKDEQGNIVIVIRDNNGMGRGDDIEEAVSDISNPGEDDFLS